MKHKITIFKEKMTEKLPKDLFTPALHLLYSSATAPTPEVSQLVKHIAGLEAAIRVSDVRAAWQYQGSQKSLGEIHFGEHTIQVSGLSAPLPNAVINHTIHVTHWQPQIKAAMRQHHAHLNLIYQGSHQNPVEKMITLYQAASAFQNENLLGIANRQAWTAHPPADFLSAEKIASYRRDFPFMLWVGYVKFYTDKESYWLATKGHHIFDVPDLAYFIDAEEEADDITQAFANIFYYLYENDVVVTAGDTLEIGKDGQQLRFAEIPEGAEFLMGPSGALVIEPIDHQDSPASV